MVQATYQEEPGLMVQQVYAQYIYGEVWGPRLLILLQLRLRESVPG